MGDLATVIPILISIAAVVISLVTAWITRNVGSKTILSANKDTVMSAIIECNKRYEDLYRCRDEIEEAYSKLVSDPLDSYKTIYDRKIEGYFRRFWQLKSDQIDYWILGYIDSDTLVTWLYSMFNAFLDNKKVGAQTYRDSWSRDYSREHHLLNPTMSKLFDQLSTMKRDGRSDQRMFAILFAEMLTIEKNNAEHFAFMRENTISFNNLLSIYDSELCAKISQQLAGTSRVGRL